MTTFQTCSACGQRKPEAAFERGAPRCRVCAALSTAALRETIIQRRTVKRRLNARYAALHIRDLLTAAGR